MCFVYECCIIKYRRPNRIIFKNLFQKVYHVFIERLEFIYPLIVTYLSLIFVTYIQTFKNIQSVAMIEDFI